VGSNLHGALIRFRRAIAEAGTPQQPLWVDAICIDQADFSERESQVRLMGRIYKQADYVFADLGSPVPTAKMFTEFLDFMTQVNERRKHTKPYDPLSRFSASGLGI